MWGAPRIHGELLTLGFEIAESTVSKYMIRRRGPPSQTWRTFLRNHADAIAAIEGTSIRVRQFLLPGFEHEKALLQSLQEWAKTHGALCTYNGRTFDVPLIETRYLLHRLPFPFAAMPAWSRAPSSSGWTE